MKSGFYATTGDDQLSWWTEKTPEPDLYRKRAWSLVCWSATAFWVLTKPLHLSGTLSKLTRCTKNCSVCSWRWSTEWAQFFSTTTSHFILHNQHFRSWTKWAMKFCLVHHIHLTSVQLTTTSSEIWTTFCRESICAASRRQAENAFQESIKSWTQTFLL